MFHASVKDLLLPWRIHCGRGEKRGVYPVLAFDVLHQHTHTHTHFQFFSPDSMSTLRGSYGQCKGRCLIRVLHLFPAQTGLCKIAQVHFDRVCPHNVYPATFGGGIFPANSSLKWLSWHVHVPVDCAGSHNCASRSWGAAFSTPLWEVLAWYSTGPKQKILWRFRWDPLRGPCMTSLQMPCFSGASMNALVGGSGEVLVSRSCKIRSSSSSRSFFDDLRRFSSGPWHEDLAQCLLQFLGADLVEILVTCCQRLLHDLVQVLVRRSCWDPIGILFKRPLH